MADTVLAQLREWVTEASSGGVDPNVLCPTESVRPQAARPQLIRSYAMRVAVPCAQGKQLCRVPEVEFLARCMACHGMTEKRAKLFYLKRARRVAPRRPNAED